jgi:hypothetical protein
MLFIQSGRFLLQEKSKPKRPKIVTSCEQLSPNRNLETDWREGSRGSPSLERLRRVIGLLSFANGAVLFDTGVRFGFWGEEIQDRNVNERLLPSRTRKARLA